MKQNCQNHQTGGVIVEFAIVIVVIFILLQSSIKLCEKIALKNWIDQTAFQVVISSSQQPNSSKQADIVSKAQKAFGIFNSSSREFWRIGAFKSPASPVPPDQYACQPADPESNHPAICWQLTSATSQVSLNLQGIMGSAWNGNDGSSSQITYEAPYQSNSSGYYSDENINGSTVAALPKTPVIFNCNASGRCTGGVCSNGGCEF